MDTASAAGPETLHEATQMYGLVLDDKSEMDHVWPRVKSLCSKLRGVVEKTTASAFNRTVVSEASADELDKAVNELFAELNYMMVVQDKATRNATDFYTLVIDRILSQRRPHEVFRAPDEPLHIDVRQTGLGASTIIDDDDVATANRLHTSLF